MELTWWNEDTYKDVCNFYKTSRRCAINNATGTGKTSVIAKVIHDYYDGPESILVIAPRKEISDQYNNEMYELQDMFINFTTYTKLGTDFKNGKLKYNKLKLIIFDELHRIGAKTWFPAAEALIDMNPNAKILGATATPKRNDKRHKTSDMIELLFDDNRAGNFDIITCLKEKILPTPIYVDTLYEAAYNELEDSIKKQAMKLKDEIEREKAFNIIKENRINWEASFGYDKIIETFLHFDDMKNTSNKILVFCKNKAHIKEMRDTLDSYFKKFYESIGANIIIDEYHTSTNDEPFNRFVNNNDPNLIQILYSIDKFEEGIHVNGLNAIIMIRDTNSEIKYFQQLGRVLSLSGIEHPVVIDLVGNSNKVNATDIFTQASMEIENDLGNAFDNIRNGRGNHSRRDIPVKIYSVKKDAIDTFEKVKRRVIEQSLYTYKDEKGTIDYFAEKYHKDRMELYMKINKQDMTIKQAIETSDDIIDYDIEYNGEIVNINKLCRRKGISDIRLFDFRYKHNKDKTVQEIIDSIVNKTTLN